VPCRCVGGAAPSIDSGCPGSFPPEKTKKKQKKTKKQQKSKKTKTRKEGRSVRQLLLATVSGSQRAFSFFAFVPFIFPFSFLSALVISSVCGGFSTPI
jgi:hypothetical protein